MNQKRTGIVLSYINLFAGMALNLFITPLMISTFGDADYSIFKVMQSFAGPLSMFNLGISTIVARNIVKCKTIGESADAEKRNTLALSLIASAMIAVLIVVAGLVMMTCIPTLYGKNYDADTIVLAQKIFMVFVLSTAFHVMTDAFSGCLIGHERFVVSSAIQLVRSVAKIFVLLVLLKSGCSVLAVVLVDCALSLFVLLCSSVYTMAVLHEFPKLTYFDKKQTLEMLLFGAAIFLQAIVNQVNNNLDNVILGAYISDKSVITMYASALAIYAVYNSLISVIFNFFLPQATKLVTQNASGEELTDFVITPGRYQAVIAVGCICGFALFGKNFIQIWIGPSYMHAYWVALLLMIPVTIPLVENAAISILDATLKRGFRSFVLASMAVLNVLISILLVSKCGFWGALIGTVASLIIGHGILMNVYYAKVFRLEIGRMFFSIFKGILPAGLLASAFCIPLSLYLSDTILFFCIKCLCFSALYGIFLWLFGLKKSEKRMISGLLGKFTKRRNSAA